MNQHCTPSSVTAKHRLLFPGKAWIIWAAAALFYFYEMILRVSPSVMTHQLMADFQVNSTVLGLFASVYYYAYVPLQIPCGLFVDKLGPRLVITISSLLCTLGTFLFAQSETLLWAQIGRFMVGAGSACAFISCLKITVEWFSPAQFALIAGLTNMMGTLGGTFAGRPLAVLVNAYGWREASLLAAFTGIIVTIIAWIFIRDYPAHLKEHEDLSHKLSLWKSLKINLASHQIWLIGLIGGFMYLPISAFTELWAVPFLMCHYNISSEIASSASIMLFVGMAIGGPLAAKIADILKQYVFVMKLSAILTSTIFFALLFTEYFSLTFVFLLLFAAGVTISGQVLCFTLARNNCSPEISGTTLGFTNALVMLSGLIFQPLLGLILDLAWDGVLSETGIRIYAPCAYQLAILAIPICLLASYIGLRWVRETYPQSH